MTARFSVPGQTDPGVHAASYTMGIGPFPLVKRPARDANHPPQLAPRLKKEYSYTFTPLLGPHGRLQRELYVLLRLWNDPLHMSLELLHFITPSSQINFHPFLCSCLAMLCTGIRDIHTADNTTNCTLLIATVLRCKILKWTTCFGRADHLQVHMEPRYS